jgi:hypothetical protein
MHNLVSPSSPLHVMESHYHLSSSYYEESAFADPSIWVRLYIVLMLKALVNNVQKNMFWFQQWQT